MYYVFLHEIQDLAVLLPERSGNESIPGDWDYSLKYMLREKK